MPSVHPIRCERGNGRRRLAAAGLLAAIASMVAFAAPSSTLAATGGDWPCVQRKVPRLSIGQVWNGPAAEGDWKADPEIRDLALTLASRRLPVEEAGPLIDAFADKAGPDKAAKLTLLFSGVFEVIDRDRATVVAGIERYSKRQQALAARIGDAHLKVAELKRSGDSSNAVLDKIEDQEAALVWDTRIYEEREQSLTYVCEVPVLYEQRAFAIAKLIQAKLD
jgi:hypothetical protein